MADVKLSALAFLAAIPDTALIYVVDAGGSFKTSKLALMAGLGVGSTPHNDKVNYSGATITVPAGFTGVITNLNDFYANVTFTVAGVDLTITGGAITGELLLINGKY